MTNFVEVVLVELPYKGRKVTVLEVFGEDLAGESIVLYCMQASAGASLIRKRADTIYGFAFLLRAIFGLEAMKSLLHSP